MSKTCEQLREEIVGHLGFFPELFDPAITNSDLLTELWGQTLTSYLDSPLPRNFKEKLFVYLASYCGIPYRVFSHAERSTMVGLSCEELLGMFDEQEDLFGASADEFLDTLFRSETIGEWPAADTELYRAILGSSFQLFLRKPGWHNHQLELVRVLGSRFYTGLVDFVAYMHHCKLWVESHPEFKRKLSAGRGISTLGRQPSLMKAFWMKSDIARARMNGGRTAPERVKSEVMQTLQGLLSEKRFAEKIIESSLDGIIAYDTHFRYLLWNPVMEKMTGIYQKDALGKICFDVFPHLKETGKDKVLRQVLAGRSVIIENQEYRIPGVKDCLYFEAHHSPLIDEDGKIIGGLAILRDISDRRRTEETLRRREEEYRAFCENAGDIIFTVSLDGVIRTLNPAFEKLLGWPVDEWKGKHFAPLAHPDDHAVAMENFGRASGGQEVHGFELRILARDGSYQHHEAMAFPQLKDGKIVNVVGMSRDITERRKLEEERAALIRAQAFRSEAEASELRYRQLAEAIPQIVWTALPNGQLDYGNRRFSDFTGVERGSALGEGWVGSLHPVDKDRTRQEWTNAVAAGENYRTECRFRRFDGTYRWHLILAIPVKDGESRVVKWFGTATDIDEQKQVQEALMQSEQRSRVLVDELARTENRYRLVAQATNDCIWDWDLNTNKIERNIGMKALFGYSEAEVKDVVDWWKDNLHPEDRERVISSLEGAMRDAGDAWSEEYRYRCADGTFANIFDRGSIVRNADGEPVRMLGAMIDITEQKRAEEALRRKTEGLARSNAELEQFAYVASHDLKEPLRMVNSYLQLLEKRYKEKLDPDAVDFLNFAREGAERMYDLIDDLLAYSRIGAPSEVCKPISLTSVLEVALANLDTAIAESGAMIRFQDLPVVTGERSQFVQLFQNLLANAIKFRSERRLEIRISSRRLGNRYLISVEDNGIGIATEFAKRIFIIFQRLHTREKYPGTGIGLAICKKIVERHGGSIWVESREGAGSTFYFELPEVVESESNPK